MTQASAGTGFPLPGTGRATVAGPAPEPGEGGGWGRRARRSTPPAGSSYDGRATKEENFSERTGLARRAGPDGRLVPEGDGA